MKLFRHGRVSGNRLGPIGHDWEFGHPNLIRIGLAVVFGGRFSRASGIQRKEEAELQARVGDEFFLLTFEDTCLDFAAVSVTRRHVEYVVLPGKIVHRHHLTALIDKREVGHGVADGGTRAHKGSGVVANPAAGVTLLHGVGCIATAVTLLAIIVAVAIRIGQQGVATEHGFFAIGHAIAIAVGIGVARCRRRGIRVSADPARTV